jgi:hypothetical protein
MFLRAFAVAGLAVALVAGPASAAGIHGRGPGAQAALDAMLVGRGNERVQVLTRLCADPERVRQCVALSHSLRRAIENAVDRRITWVDERRTRGPVFWVFAPVEFGHGVATASYAWWDGGAFACRGGSDLLFEQQRGGWSGTEGFGWGACPAT